MWKVFGATILFAVVHSALASRRAKAFASRQLSERSRNALYRPFYLLQSAITVALLIAYLRSLPSRTLYQLQGPAVWPLRLGQFSALLWATGAAYHVGLTEILGLRGLLQWTRGDGFIPPEPEAQGPALGVQGAMRVRGPFRLSRHPLNLAPLPVLWLNPRMTTNLLAFNLLATVYLVLGSRHEEHRLRQAYGNPYTPVPRQRRAILSACNG